MEKHPFITAATLLLTLLLPTNVSAQDHVHVHTHHLSTHWDFPFATDSTSHFDFSTDKKTLNLHTQSNCIIPFSAEYVDSLTFEDDPATETKDYYKVFQMYITTADGEDIVSKDYYKDCYVSVNGMGSFSSFSVPAEIRGRGNSSFLWYDKKPLRIKLGKKRKVLGLGKAKSWVLLANYRDITDLMNTYVFETGHWMGLPYTNHTRYVEVFVNGDYRGVYQLTEQVQQNESRVALSDDRGILITLDQDDGPGLSPGESDNFYSAVYNMPVAVKYPDDELLTQERRDSIREVFGELETAIRNKDYTLADSLLDMESFIRYLQIQEFVYNVELSAPRSIFIHKEGDGKWTMGPLWDFDAGYDFDWGNMYTGHTFFTDYRETVMGSNPYKRNGNYRDVPQFFTNLFGCKEFVRKYKETWALYADSIVSRNWTVMEKYLANMRQGAMQRDANRWPIRNKQFETEVSKMHEWLTNRAAYMTDLIRNIPEPEDEVPITDETLCGTVYAHTTMQFWDGYGQNVKVNVDKAKVLSLLGLTDDTFKPTSMTIVPLNTDGTPGPNNTNGVYGGWFDEDGNPRTWDIGHVYIEVFDDLFNWNCGVRNDNCYDDEHTVTMQYQYADGGVLKKVNVRVNFTIESGGGW